MLETEIKKLTAALEANTAALIGGANANSTSAPAAPSAPVAPVPAAPVPAAQPMTYPQAQAELGAIVQALGDGTQVQATMVQYGSPRLNEIPAENLFSLVQACKALVAA